MTVETETASAGKPGVLAKGKGFLKVLAVLVFIAAVGGWISLGVGLYLDVPRETRLVLAIVAALATEALFWTIAALLGVSVVQARKRIWRMITGKGGNEA